MSVFTEPPPPVRLSLLCPDCGKVTLWMGDVTLRICCDDNSITHRFQCPSCTQTYVLPVKYQGTAKRLIEEGIPVEWWWLPSEVFEAHPYEAPITNEEVDEWQAEIRLIEHWVNQL